MQFIIRLAILSSLFILLPLRMAFSSSREQISTETGYYQDRACPFRFQIPQGWDYRPYFQNGRVELQLAPQSVLFRPPNSPAMTIWYRYERGTPDKDPVSLQIERDIQRFKGNGTIEKQEIMSSSLFEKEAVLVFHRTHYPWFLFSSRRSPLKRERTEETQYAYHQNILIWFELIDDKDRFNNRVLTDLVKTLEFDAANSASTHCGDFIDKR